MDHPNLRAQDDCPLCGDPKPTGGILCWPCYRKGEWARAAATIEAHEARLEAGRRIVAGA